MSCVAFWTVEGKLAELMTFLGDRKKCMYTIVYNVCSVEEITLQGLLKKLEKLMTFLEYSKLYVHS